MALPAERKPWSTPTAAHSGSLAVPARSELAMAAQPMMESGATYSASAYTAASWFKARPTKKPSDSAMAKSRKIFCR